MNSVVGGKLKIVVIAQIMTHDPRENEIENTLNPTGANNVSIMTKVFLVPEALAEGYLLHRGHYLY